MYQCPNCGKPNKANYNYCYKCGVKLQVLHTHEKIIKKKKYNFKKQFKVNYIKKEFKVNNFITLKLEKSKTVIYVKDKRFIQCKYLLIDISANEIELYEDIKSIDDASNNLDHTLEYVKINRKIPAEMEFWGHCSNLQVWREHNYDTRLLHSNLAFPLLKKLTDVGDQIAKRVFKEEIAKRMESGHKSVVTYLISENYLNYLNDEELEIVLINLKISIAREFSKKYKEILDEVDLNCLLDLLLDNIKDSKVLKLKQIGLLKSDKKEIQAGFKIRSKRVVKIKLVNYGLTVIPESIGSLEKLENLDLSHNRIKKIPESIGFLQNLQKLNLGINQIHEIPESLGNLISLKQIKLDHNQLTNLPESITNLKSLEFLSLWSNSLVALPERIGDLTSLQIIGLSYNNLIKIPETISNLNSIQTLDLSNNHLTKIPEKIGYLKSLQVLWLNDNYLEDLPPSITSIASLKQVYLFSNPCVVRPNAEIKNILDEFRRNSVNVK